MGLRLLDQYSLLHFAAGVVAFFWKIPLIWWLVINLVYEAFENSELGMEIIRGISVWPGGKPYRDANINILGDILCVVLGWCVAYLLDKFVKANFPQTYILGYGK